MTGKAHMPPVPRANRAPMGSAPSSPEGDLNARVAEKNKESKNRNLAEQGRQGNVKQNTTNQGYQQDR
jgi:hypothetical protein